MGVIKMPIVLQLMAAELLFLWIFKRKPYYIAKLVVLGVLLLVIDEMMNQDFSSVWTATIYFVLIFLGTFGAMLLCFEGKWSEILFCCLAGYCTQNLACNIYQSVLVLRPYLTEKTYEWVYTIAVWSVTVVVYIIIYYLFARRFTEYEELFDVQNRNVMVLSVVVLVLVVFLNWTVSADYTDVSGYLTGKVLMGLCELLLLIYQLDLLERDKLVQEKNTIWQMWYAQQKYYEIEKEKIDQINIKYHDLKHLLGNPDSRSKKEYATEVKQIIQEYDSIYHTGNVALDVVLTEKSRLYEKNHIRFTCIADGKELSFISDADIYFLFGNAMDNAVESVQRIEQEEKRVIALIITLAGNMVRIHMENYYVGELRYDGETFLTTKQNKLYHGYGMKSMQFVVEKYGGTMAVTTEDDVFMLNILFPAAGGS